MLKLRVQFMCWLIHEYRFKFTSKCKIKCHGPCVVCGKPVNHTYPWYTKNPDKGGKPLHDECFKKFYV